MALKDDWSQANLLPVDAALCAYGVRLTEQPSAMTEAEVQGLRGLGLSDEAILNAVQVVAFFNYINRVADSIHVDLEPEMAPYPQPRA